MTAKRVPSVAAPVTRLPPIRLTMSLVSLLSIRDGIESSARTRGTLLYAMPSKLTTVADEAPPQSVGVAATAAMASAPRLAAWPVAYLTYSSPIRKLKFVGHPSNGETAITTMYPRVPGSASDVLKLAVWLFVKQMNVSATPQLAPSMK